MKRPKINEKESGVGPFLKNVIPVSPILLLEKREREKNAKNVAEVYLLVFM